MQMQSVAGETQVQIETRNFIIRVYHWMTAGLAITGAVAWLMVSNPPMILGLVHIPFLFMGLLIAELVLVFYLAGWVMTMSSSTASLVFLLYSALNGVTISVIFLVYTRASIANAFFVTAGTFGAMSLYGYTTKDDLTTIGNFCIMGLFGIILGSVANWFLHSPMLDWITTYASILIFVGLTAYDTQKIKQMNVIGNEGTEEDTKEAISGALALYLDFINLFLSILRATGKRNR
jgi:FtsH-binding integral membrane protein